MSVSIRLARPEWAASTANGLIEAADARAASAAVHDAVGDPAASAEDRGMEQHYRWLGDRFGDAVERLPDPSGGAE